MINGEWNLDTDFVLLILTHCCGTFFTIVFLTSIKYYHQKDMMVSIACCVPWATTHYLDTRYVVVCHGKVVCLFHFSELVFQFSLHKCNVLVIRIQFQYIIPFSLFPAYLLFTLQFWPLCFVRVKEIDIAGWCPYSLGVDFFLEFEDCLQGCRKGVEDRVK